MNVSSTNIAARLESAIGSSRVATDAATCSNYSVDEVLPTAVAKPSSAEQAAEVVRFPAQENLTLIPTGTRTKLQIGTPPTPSDIPLDLPPPNPIVYSDPAYLPLTAAPATPTA